MSFWAFGQLATTCIFFSVWGRARVKWNNSQNSTQKMRTWISNFPPLNKQTYPGKNKKRGSCFGFTRLSAQPTYQQSHLNWIGCADLGTFYLNSSHDFDFSIFLCYAFLSFIIWPIPGVFCCLYRRDLLLSSYKKNWELSRDKIRAKKKC